MPDRESLLRTIARDQRGLFTLAQARAIGFPTSTVTGRARAGRYERIHPGIYGIAGGSPSWHRAVLAGVLSLTEPGAASHATAAHLWNLTDRRPRGIEVVTRRHRKMPRSDLIVHESLDLIASDIVDLKGIPVTTAPRTIVDLGASIPFGSVARCLDKGLRTSLFTLLDVELLVMRVGRSGRTGVGVIRPLLDERRRWQGLTESDLEDLFRRVVDSSSLPMPTPQVTVTDEQGGFVGRYDFAYTETMTLIELDSEGFHMDPESFQRDREKQNRAQMLGWTVYRFTYRQLRDRPDEVLAVLASMTPDIGRH